MRNNLEFSTIAEALDEARYGHCYQFFTTVTDAATLAPMLAGTPWYTFTQIEKINGVDAVRWYSQEREFQAKVEQGWVAPHVEMQPVEMWHPSYGAHLQMRPVIVWRDVHY